MLNPLSRISPFLMAAVLSLVVVDAAASRPRSVPLVVPFSAQVKGTVLQVDIEIREERTYDFVLRLAVSDNHDSRLRISHLAGSGAHRADRTPADTGLAIPLELIIRRLPLQHAAPIYQKRLSDFALRAHSTT